MRILLSTAPWYSSCSIVVHTPASFANSQEFQGLSPMGGHEGDVYADSAAGLWWACHASELLGG